jgi:hypothetical protein
MSIRARIKTMVSKKEGYTLNSEVLPINFVGVR